jgi:hypothetical protein
MHVFTSYSDSHIANGFAPLRSRINGLPAVHRASLGALLWHLARVASHSNKNGMELKNLAFIFAPLVFGDDGSLDSQEQVRCILFSIYYAQVWQDSVMETLIDNAHILLDECSPCESPPPSSISYPRERTPVMHVMDDNSSTASTMVAFPKFEDLTARPSPQSLSPTRSPESLYSSTLSTPPMSSPGSSVCEELSGGHTSLQAPVPLLPQLPDSSTLQIFPESAGSERPVRNPTPNLHLQPASSACTPNQSDLSIPRSRPGSLRRRSPIQAIQRSLTPDVSSMRRTASADTTLENHSQEQDVTRLGTTGSINERSRRPSEVSLVPSLPRFAPQQQRRPSPSSIPGTQSTRTSTTDCRQSSATSLASPDFVLPPGSFTFQ